MGDDRTNIKFLGSLFGNNNANCQGFNNNNQGFNNQGFGQITKGLVKITKGLVKITKDLVKITKDSVKITKDLGTTTTKYSAGVANAPFPIQRRIEEALKRQNVQDLTIQGRNGVTQQVTASAVMQNNLANMLTTLGLMKPVQVLQGFQTLLRGVVEI